MSPLETLFRARELNQQAENSSQFFSELAWGSNKLSDVKVEIHSVPGTHISMMSEQNVKVLAEKIRQSLEQARNK